MIFNKSIRGFVLIYFLVVRSTVRCELNLELVQVLFRHGDRTPLEKEFIPTDRKDSSLYQPYGGYGQLTNKGKMREYQVGQMLRSHYKDFLGEYQPRSLYAYSSNMDRTKMSLQLVLAGLYPPTHEEQWSDYLNWSPIPTFTLPIPVDMLLFPHLCPTYKTAYNEIRKSNSFKNRLAKHKQFCNFLSEKTGYKNVDDNTANAIYNMLMSHKSMNITWPEWITADVFQEIQEMVDLNYEYKSFTTTMKKFNGGTMIRAFLRNLDTTRKLYLYSGHDVNVAGFIRAHNLTYPNTPDYGTAVIMEKYRDRDNEVSIKFFIWDGAINKRVPIKLTKCQYYCPLKDYLKIVSQVIPSNEEMRCLMNNLPEKDFENIVNGEL